MLRHVTRSWAAFLVVGFLGCSNAADVPPLPGLADGCNINSECASPLVCAFRRCHTACETTRDCPADQRCMASDKPYHVCQLPEEVHCAYNSDCPTGQLCGVDGECRDQCAADRDCVSGQVCTQGTCAEPTELDAGKLPVVTPEGGTAPEASTGLPCAYNSECPAPLLCKANLCAYECLGDPDCPTGQSCVANRCAGSEGDAGLDGQQDGSPPCSYNSQCDSPLICRGGQCAYECLGDADCPDGLTCQGNRCKSPATDGGTDAVQPCSYNSQCGAPLVCRAGVCAYECLADGDCASGWACVANRCEEVITDASTEPPPDAPPSWGNGCVYNSQCTAPLICRSGECAYQCLGDADCPSGDACVAFRCQPLPAEAGPDAGTDAPPDAPDGWSNGCQYNSDCIAPLVCHMGVCGWECLGDADCAAGAVCVDHSCSVSLPEAGADAVSDGCVPTDCLSQSKNCGLIDDGCGGTISCGSCSSGQSCGGGGIANVCATGTCVPKSCASLDKNCGTVSDGCSWLIQCGTCTTPQTCGGGGVANVCGCTGDPVVACAGKDCGQVFDSCGKTVSCGTCNLPQTCGGGGTTNLCGCTKTTCSAQGKDCGVIPDGCGGTLDCGTCASGSCGGGSVANVCGAGSCLPTTCSAEGKDCGIISDKCGDILSCGACTAPETCGGGGSANVCGCTPTTCAAQGKSCGSIPDGCGGTLNCGTCASGTCGGGGTPNVCGCTPTTCAIAGKDCGTISNGCGGLLSCGTCTSPQVCGGGGIPNVCAVQQTPLSCQGGGQGAGKTCGPNNDDCCSSLLVPGGTFNRDNNAAWPGGVNDFRLDRYLVTVGRFRAFLEAGGGVRTTPPVAWSGAHPLISTSGWNPAWNNYLATDLPALESALRSNTACWNGGGYGTWTNSPAGSDNQPINCATWFEAHAFCAWDGAWLATEVEVNYAQLGGSEQRVWPWSNPPSQDVVNLSYANFYGYTGSPNYPVSVGSKSPKGDGRWGQTDLLGNLSQWMMDNFQSPYANSSCFDCAYLGGGTNERVLRNGNWNSYPVGSTYRSGRPQGDRDSRIGFRCARLP